jgi:hypothetical protein
VISGTIIGGGRRQIESREEHCYLYAVDVIYLRGKFETREGVRDENKIVPLARVIYNQ